MSKKKVLNRPYELFAQSQADIVSIDDWLHKRYTSKKIKLGRICYDSAQAVEKLLKGYAIENNVSVDYGHNLNHYLYIVININKDFSNITKECIYLNSFNAENRYNSDGNISKNTVIKALKCLKKIYDFPEIKKLNNNLVENKYFEKIPDNFIDSIIEKLKNNDFSESKDNTKKVEGKGV